MNKKAMLCGAGIIGAIAMSSIVSNADSMYKLTENVNLRSGAGTGYNKICLIPKGSKVNYISKYNGWLKVNYNGKTGWMIDDYAIPVYGNNDNTTSNSGFTKVRYTTNALNFRKGPGTSYYTMELIPSGTKVYCGAESNGWLNIKYNGKTGWISAQYTSSNISNTSTTNNSNNTVNGTCYTTANLWLRDGASTGYNKLCLIPKDSKLNYTAKSNGWYKVVYGGKTGWISSEYVSSNKTSNNSSSSTNYNYDYSMPIEQRRALANKQRANTAKTIAKIKINTKSNILTCYDINGNVLKSMVCSTGKSSTPTPKGTFKIGGFAPFRDYYKDKIAGGAYNNPLGVRFIALKVYENGYVTYAYGIHGTIYNKQLGSSVSNGCTRVDNNNVIWIYDHLMSSATVTIV